MLCFILPSVIYSIIVVEKGQSREEETLLPLLITCLEINVNARYVLNGALADM